MTPEEKVYECSGTLCWRCEWAAGKQGKCSWACEFKPVEGWEAIPDKMLIASATQTPDGKPKYTDTYHVKWCPLFEVMSEIKKQQRMNAAMIGLMNAHTPTNDLRAQIERLWIVEHKDPQAIADELGIPIWKFYWHRRKIKEKYNGQQIQPDQCYSNRKRNP